MKNAEVREKLSHLSGGDYDLWQARLAIFRDNQKLHSHKMKPIFGDGRAPNMMPAEQVGYIRVKKYDHL